MLESKGYIIDNEEFRGRDGIINGNLPIGVNTVSKTYNMMGNVTCAAALCSGGGLWEDDKLFEYFEIEEYEKRIHEIEFKISFWEKVELELGPDGAKIVKNATYHDDPLFPEIIVMRLKIILVLSRAQNTVLKEIGESPDDNPVVRMGQMQLFVQKCGLSSVVFSRIFWSCHREEEDVITGTEPYSKEAFLNEVFLTPEDYDKLYKLLLYKKNVILQGAPGECGKAANMPSYPGIFMVRLLDELGSNTELI